MADIDDTLQVDRFAGEWTPPGGVKVPSMLKVTRENNTILTILICKTISQHM